jgi:ketosteroid isomerase-like protein
VDQFEQVAVQLAALFNAKNAVALALLYDDNAVLMPPGERIVRGRAAIETWFEQALGGLGPIRIMPLETRAFEDDAIQVGTFTMDDETLASGKYVLTLKQTHEKWLIQWDIWNLDHPSR